MVWFVIMNALLSVPGGSIYMGSSEVTVEEMLNACSEADIVFVGEKHDDAFAHEWELFIWKSLASEERVLALEMFETDVQDILDSYLIGEITEEEFLAESRPWDNYPSDYAPMVEFAKENGFKIIAANVPRMNAAMVARSGLDAVLSLPGFENLVVDSSNVSYKEMFLATMDAIGDQMHAMPVSQENLYRAQLLKDAVMASSIYGQKVVFVCGSFHCDFYSGIPDQLTTDSYVTISVLGESEELSSEIADFIITRPVE